MQLKNKKKFVAYLICGDLHQTLQLALCIVLLLLVNLVINTNRNDCGLAYASNLSATLLAARQPIIRHRPHQARQQLQQTSSSLIIEANHNYPNYNYQNHHLTHVSEQQPQQQQQRHHQQRSYSHTNEIAENHRDWSSETMNNVTVSVGRNATFECIFPDLKDFRLAWFHKDNHTLLALHDSVIVKNRRISARSHANTTFYLTIQDVRAEDRGCYMCQVNTDPMRSKIGYLEVNVPPTFVEQKTSSDVDIREGSNVSLLCTATGRPVPEISWRREDGRVIVLENKSNSSINNGSGKINNIYHKLGKASLLLKGNYLNITNATRSQSGAYLCIANNGVPSPISKRIFLGVSFAPSILSNKESIGVYVDSRVTLECNIEAYPRPSVYWKKDDQMPPIIHSNHKYEIDLLDGNTSYRFILKLKILNVHKSDIGKYTCVAKNAFGESKASLRLYEIERRKVIPPKTLSKSLFLDLFTTRNTTAKSETTHTESKIAQNVANHDDTFSRNRENVAPEVFDYDADFISPEMSNEATMTTSRIKVAGKENKATATYLWVTPVGCWPVFLLILQRMLFVLTRFY